jgi:hypothetical protein
MRRSMRLIAVLLVVGAVGFGASAAFGTTGSSTAGSLSFSVTTADAASRGQAMNYSSSITNDASVATPFTLTYTLSGPAGTHSVTYHVGLKGNATYNKSGSFSIPRQAPTGVYTLTMAISSANGSSSAQAQTTVS